jgi:hypothetical protein
VVIVLRMRREEGERTESKPLLPFQKEDKKTMMS